MTSGRYEYCRVNAGAKVLKKIRADMLVPENIRALDDAALFAWFADHDPSAPNIRKSYVYLQWLCTQYTSAGNFQTHDLEKIKTALTIFDRYKSELPKTGISAYTPSSLLATVAGYQGQLHLPTEIDDEALAKLQTSVVYEGPAGSICIPHTKFAADYVSQDAGWCIHSDKGDMFSTYNSDGPLFLFYANDPVTQKQNRYLSHVNQDGGVADRWDNEAKPADWALIKKVLAEALEAGAIPVSTLVLAAGIPLHRIPGYRKYMTQADAFDLALFEPDSIDKIPTRFLTPDLCAALIARYPEKLSALPKDKQTLSLKMLAASAYEEISLPNRAASLHMEAKASAGDDAPEWYTAYVLSIYPNRILRTPEEKRTSSLKSIALSLSAGHVGQALAMEDAEKGLLYLSVVATNAKALKQVPADIATEGFLVRAVRINPDVFELIGKEKSTLEIRMAYTEKTGEGIDEDTEKFAALIKKHSPTGKFTDMNLAAAQTDVLAAMRRNNSYTPYAWLPQRLRGYEIYRTAIDIASKHPGYRDVPEGIAPVEVFQLYTDLVTAQALNLLPSALRTAELCLEALKHNKDHAGHVPAALLSDRDFLAKAIPLAPQIVRDVPENVMDAKLVDLSLAQAKIPSALFWRIPDSVWTEKYADAAARDGIDTLYTYAPKKFQSPERTLAACKVHLNQDDLRWGRVRPDAWSDELVDIALRAEPMAISMKLANKEDPVIPRKFLTPERLIALGRAFVALKNTKDKKVKEKMPYYYGEGLKCPGNYFTAYDTSGLEKYEHPYLPAALFAPHIQAIDPQGHARQMERLKNKIKKRNKDDWGSFFYGILGEDETPKAYCDADMALLILQAAREQKTPERRLDTFLEFFSPGSFTQAVFDQCCHIQPTFFLKRHDDSWPRKYSIDPDYAAFVKAEHIERAKAHGGSDIAENLIGRMPRKTAQRKPSI